MIYIGNIEILTAKSAIYLGNVGQGEPERCGYVRMDRYTDLLRALGQARGLVDAVKAQAGVADPAILARTDHAIRTALSEVYAKVFAAGTAH